MSIREIWQFYWNPILLFVLTTGFTIYILPANSGFRELIAAWSGQSIFISIVADTVRVIWSLAWFVHFFFISWASVYLQTARGIYRAVKQGPKSISKQSFLSGSLVICIYAVTVAHFYQGFIETYSHLTSRSSRTAPTVAAFSIAPVGYVARFALHSAA
jgi:hypothetical protein